MQFLAQAARRWDAAQPAITAMLAVLPLISTVGCKSGGGDGSDVSSVVVQPRSNSPKVFLYVANTQNVKKFASADKAAARKYDTDCTQEGNFVTIADFRAEVPNAGLTTDEGEAILDALRDKPVTDDDAIDDQGSAVKGAKVRKLFALLWPAGGSGNNNAGNTGGGTAGPAVSLDVPKPGSRNNAIPKDTIIKAWRELRKTYYESNAIYTKGKRPNPGEIWQCARACPPNWSDLACHYYSHTPSYDQVVPNIRGCFTRVARGGVLKNKKRMEYPDVYDYCVFQDYDAVLGRQPAFDQKVIDANKKAGNKPGVMKWIDDNQAEVFKFIMFPDGWPFTWDPEQEQEVINEFYGVDLQGKTAYTVKDKAQVDECKKKRPVRNPEVLDGTHCSYKKKTMLREVQ